jgi:DNA-binding transcriptional MocR family regulator
MALSQRARSLQPSPTLAITAKANEMKTQGIDVIGFGDPSRLRFSFATSEDNIREGLKRIAECVQEAR